MNHPRIPPTIKFTPLPAPIETAINTAIPSKSMVLSDANPCRKCLQDNKPGQTMLLVSYDPWLADSPYRQSGPVFIHQDPVCELADLPVGSLVPMQQLSRLLSVRAFDKQHMMVGSRVIGGRDLISCAESMFGAEGEAEVEYIHVHYAGPGCFAVRLDRVTGFSHQDS